MHYSLEFVRVCLSLCICSLGNSTELENRFEIRSRWLTFTWVCEIIFWDLIYPNNCYWLLDDMRKQQLVARGNSFLSNFVVSTIIIWTKLAHTKFWRAIVAIEIARGGLNCHNEKSTGIIICRQIFRCYHLNYHRQFLGLYVSCYLTYIPINWTIGDYMGTAIIVIN